MIIKIACMLLTFAALGSKPEHLDVILRADVNHGRVRRGPSPRLKFSRNTSSTLHSSSSGVGSPEHGTMPRFETPAQMVSLDVVFADL